MYYLLQCILLLSPFGSCYFVINPRNATACINSTATFTCAINESITMFWLINGMDPGKYHLSSTETQPYGPGILSNITLPGSYQFEGANVTCFYQTSSASLVIYSVPAFLAVQGPPANLTASIIDQGLVQLSWASSNAQHDSLSYIVHVRSTSGGSVYYKTSRERKLNITTSDPCDKYFATVLCQARPLVEESTIPGALPSNLSSQNILTVLSFPSSPRDNVTLNISTFQSWVCYYKIIIGFDSENWQTLSVCLNQTWPYSCNISLLPNHNFNLTIIAYNSYGNVSFTTSVSTHAVVAVKVNTSSPIEIECIFNPGSIAIGCFLNITHLNNGKTSCIVLERFPNNPLSNFSLCQTSYKILVTGKYLIEVYDIEVDGSVSKYPAVVDTFQITAEKHVSGYQTRILIVSISSSVSAFLILLLAGATIISCTTCSRMNKLRINRLSDMKMIPQSRSHYTASNQVQLPSARESINSGFWISDALQPAKLNTSRFQQYKVEFSDVLILHRQLIIEPKPIGEGAFGIVYGATIKKANGDNETVAVKKVKEFYSAPELDNFFDECYRMKTFNHLNIVQLIGMCLDSPDGFPLIILPLYPNGSLKIYLQKNRGLSSLVNKPSKEWSICTLIKMCLNIAQGMNYLAEKRFVHRDLAARNCMVDIDLTIKVGGFGLARETYKAEYYKASSPEKCPVKWMPPEMLRDGISTEKSDVWAYGVTCWEVFSSGSTPYPEVKNHEMLELLCKGIRMKKPTLCPPKMFKIIKQCWNIDLERRPLFSELVCNMQSFCKDS